MRMTQREIMEKGYQALVDTLGVAGAMGFIQYYNPGEGDYSQNRHQWFKPTSLEEVFSEMEQPEDLDRYEEIIAILVTIPRSRKENAQYNPAPSL